MFKVNKLIYHSRCAVRHLCLQWGYECELHYHSDNMETNYRHRIRYIDTDMNNNYKRNVLILPDSPGDSDNYIELCHSLYSGKYRVIIANYPGSAKVRNLSFAPPNGFTSGILVNYLTSFLQNLAVDRLDFIVAHGWAGYDALNLESVIPTSSHLVLVNFPKIFDINGAHVGPIPVELANTMHELWNNGLMRWMFRRYVDYKLATFRQAPGFENLTRDEIIVSLLYYGAVDFNRARQNAVFNNSRSLGLLNLSRHEPGYNAADRDKYRTYFGLLQRDVFSVGPHDKWQHINARKRYEVNLESQSAHVDVNSASFGQFLAGWLDWLGDRDHTMKRITQ